MTRSSSSRPISRFNDRAQNSAVYKALLESTKAIPWKIDWDTLTFSYIGPQIESLLGWEPESWMTVDDWAARMHPEDREWVVNFCVSQSQEGVDHEADYRALTKAGDYIWIRDVVHVVRREDGSVESLVGFMFDISERKRTEQELLRLQKELEALSFQDGLTGIANRRGFDASVETAWQDARRKGHPISLALLDIDYFKQYNDGYGHLKGDDCLKAVAKVLADTVSRPRDLVARFGGEEFVILLPETSGASARLVAERCRKAVLELALPHADSGILDVLSVSVGVATLVPQGDISPTSLLEQADQQLYRAKQDGRNRVVG